MVNAHVGAHVHVGIEHQDFAGALAVTQPCQVDIYKAFLRREVLAREGPVPEKAVSNPAKRGHAQEELISKLAGSDFRASGSSKVVASGGKVPKWLKLSK